MNCIVPTPKQEVLSEQVCPDIFVNSVPGNMSNFICVPSPTMVGAFRFECAYHPGYYLAYRAPNHLRVVRKIEDAENTKIDFMLVNIGTG